MNKFFRKLPLHGKLLLIGLIPFGFLFYLTVCVYNEKTEKLAIFEGYRYYIEESSTISQLINALQDERKYAFDYILTGNMKTELLLQRPKTSALIQKLDATEDPLLKGFVQFTKLRQLDSVRAKVDSLKIDANGVMHYYSNTVFRLNTLNTIPPANTPYLKPVYDELMTQKTLSEMITYFGIIRSNIYNVLQTRQYMIETLAGTYPTYDVYKSYERELLAKAPNNILAQYKNIKANTAFEPTIAYTDKLFKTFTFDDTFTAAEWWKISEQGNGELLKLQAQTWKTLNLKIDKLYQSEENSRNETMILLMLALIATLCIFTYVVFLIRQTLVKLRFAAEKISAGETGVNVQVETNDVMGRLARAILEIDLNNKALADAATAIGKGDFNIDFEPRGKTDQIGNSILAMKNELVSYNQKMENLVANRTEELARSNEDLQQFAHVASHDLKEPLRKIATFSSILLDEHAEGLTPKGKLYLAKIEGAAQRMSIMIEGVLAYSTVTADFEAFETIGLNAVVEDVKNDLELAIIQKDAEIKCGLLPEVSGMRILIYQLFYNLVSNALKFSKNDEHPVIAISATKERKTINRKTNNYIHITVTDNGIGFNQEYADKIFGVFSRLNPKEVYEGTGLGLALCKKIVNRHGGQIYAESKEDKGATFHILLPDQKP
jgi:signal transduction histidine kinase